MAWSIEGSLQRLGFPPAAGTPSFCEHLLAVVRSECRQGHIEEGGAPCSLSLFSFAKKRPGASVPCRNRPAKDNQFQIRRCGALQSVGWVPANSARHPPGSPRSACPRHTTVGCHFRLVITDKRRKRAASRPPVAWLNTYCLITSVRRRA